jgi:hypothetical protein
VPTTQSTPKLVIALVDGTLKSSTGLNKHVGISGQWTLNQDAYIDAVVLGSVSFSCVYLLKSMPLVGFEETRFSIKGNAQKISEKDRTHKSPEKM